MCNTIKSKPNEANESTSYTLLLEFEVTSLNATVVHEIEETSSTAIMEISDGSDSE